MVGGRARGRRLPPLVKGPLRVTDMVVWHTGMGMGLYGVAASGWATTSCSACPASSSRTT